MLELLCPLWWARFWLDGYKAIQLFIRHDDTLLRVETLLQKSQDDAHGDATDAAAILFKARGQPWMSLKGKE